MALFETIPYNVIKKDNNIEIREYSDVLLASTKSSPSPRLDSGFQGVFNYISGNNHENTKISMTTPVVTYEQNNEIVTGFYVPSKYNKDNVPKPKNDEVFINELKQSRYAVISFRGAWTEKNFTRNDQLLRDYLSKSNDEISSPRFILRYQPPFIPGLFRHNEIAYQIKQRI